MNGSLCFTDSAGKALFSIPTMVYSAVSMERGQARCCHRLDDTHTKLTGVIYSRRILPKDETQPDQLCPHKAGKKITGGFESRKIENTALQMIAEGFPVSDYGPIWLNR